MVTSMPAFSDSESYFFSSCYLRVLPDGYGFLGRNPVAADKDDIYVSPALIKKYRLITGDVLSGYARHFDDRNPNVFFITQINGLKPDAAAHLTPFEDLTPVFPHERIRLEHTGCDISMRIVDLVSPIGKGQRGLIVSPPKAGKTTLIKHIAKSMLLYDLDIFLYILLIDERPEEVTDIRESITGNRVHVIASTFDESAEHHCHTAEFTLGQAKRLVECKQDVVILVDSITRLARAYNRTVSPSGRTLSGGIDPAALYSPKKFFGAARNIRDGGSLTIIATALVDTGSKMDTVIYEEFKGTGNMELFLSRKLQEQRIFPAIDIEKSGTRREDLLLTENEGITVNQLRRLQDKGYSLFEKTATNKELETLLSV